VHVWFEKNTEADEPNVLEESVTTSQLNSIDKSLMKLEAASLNGFEELQERLEQDKLLNIQVTAAVAGAWFVLASVVAGLSGSGGNISIIFITALYHFGWGFFVVSHIFNYALPKVTRLEIFTKWLRDYWRWFLIGLIGVLFLYPSFWFGTIASFILGSVAAKRLKIELAEEYLAGSRPMLFRWLQRSYSQKLSNRDQGIFFGGLLLPSTEAMTHFRLTGAAGSGKTNLLRLYMQSVLPQISPGSQNRALIYDPKTEFLPIIAGMGVPQSSVIILNPFDDRAYAWDLAKDLTRDRDANELASILLPEKAGGQGNNEFFDKAARRILSGITRFFMRSAPGAWTLRDLVLAAQHIELTTLLLSQDKKLKRNLQVLGAGDTVGNVMSTVAAYIGDGLETVAAHCDYHIRAGRKFTLSEWLEGSYILVLGCDRESEATLQPLNQLLFTRASQMLLSRNTGGISYLILDELPAMGKLGKIDQIAELGRSYGVSLTIAFQSYSKLEHIYGDKVANALIGQFDKSAYLRTKDKPTAQWASEQIGDMKVVWKARSESRSRGQLPLSGSQTQGTGEQRDSNPVARPDDFMNMPKPDESTREGIHGWYRVDNHVYRHEIPSSFLSQHLLPKSRGVEAFIGVPEIADDLRLWDEEDIYRLGIQQVLAELDSEQLKDLPVDDWINLSTPSTTALIKDLNETFDDDY
jgi:type IV secretory pathway TraG/TraD family ATPase VirD4